MVFTSVEPPIEHQLTFSEVFDTDAQRSKVSIAHVGHPPLTYYSMGDMPTICGKENECIKHEHHLNLIPELAVFMDHELTGIHVITKYPFLIGPTGLSLQLSDMTNLSMVSIFGCQPLCMQPKSTFTNNQSSEVV